MSWKPKYAITVLAMFLWCMMIFAQGVPETETIKYFSGDLEFSDLEWAAKPWIYVRAIDTYAGSTSAGMTAYRGKCLELASFSNEQLDKVAAQFLQEAKTVASHSDDISLLETMPKTNLQEMMNWVMGIVRIWMISAKNDNNVSALLEQEQPLFERLFPDGWDISLNAYDGVRLTSERMAVVL